MITKTYKKSILIVLVILVPVLTLFPTPKHSQLSPEVLKLSTGNSCAKFELHIQSQKVLAFMPHTAESTLESSPGSYYFDKVMKRIKNLSKCRSDSELMPKIYKIQVKYNEQISKEGYKIHSEATEATLQVSSYSGYVYALQTLSQMISEGNSIQLGKVEDQPIVSHRGIMIDTVRHFIGVKYIRRLIEAMPLSKLNIVHWTFSNDEAFVLNMLKHPELSQSSRYSESESYSIEQVKQLISFAKLNAVSIVPEFDTPGHVRSWGLAKKWQQKNITILCLTPGGKSYHHQFDVSKSEVFELVQEVLTEADSIFRDSPYLHLGGDEAFGNCWDLRPSIKQFMTLKNLKTYADLQMYWRYEIKKAIAGPRKTIFWKGYADNLTTGPDDIIHYWGLQAQTANVAGKSESKLILSPSDYLFLNKGTTQILANSSNGRFSSWRDIYTKFTVRPNGVDPNKILGAQVCLQNQVHNQGTFQNQIWMRASAFAAKVWRNQVGPLATLVSSLVSLQKTLKSMGIQPSPITNEYCEMYPNNCYSVQQNSQLEEKLEQVLIV